MWLFGKWWRSVWICIYDLSTISELRLIEFHAPLYLVSVGPESDDLPAGWFFVWRSPSSVCSCWLSPQPLDRLQHFSLPPSHTGTSLYLKKKLTKIIHVFFFTKHHDSKTEKFSILLFICDHRNFIQRARLKPFENRNTKPS